MKIADLLNLLDYNSETGVLTWARREAGPQGSARGVATFNTRFAGTPAGSPDKAGHILVTISTRGTPKRFAAHRLAWAIHYGSWPNGEIDHINHITSDNRLSNLRDVTHAQNLKNQSLRRTSKSGATGVSWHKASSKWRAAITSNGTGKYLGCFDELTDAIQARKRAERELGFHKNHGSKENRT